jgi:hypothetical protein
MDDGIGAYSHRCRTAAGEAQAALDRAMMIRAVVSKLCATVEHQAYARKCISPFHVQRDRPKERFRKEIVASMPARKRLRSRRSRGVEVISSMGRRTGFEKQTSEVPEAFSPWRFALDANPPSNATRSGTTPNNF